mmetsp:Transcript_8875/g.25571  ORF Transcript_8875/g.25571 Transcript_8875/m.25571 type:complete len:664 (+) Transcript_8875:296-2287(+)
MDEYSSRREYEDARHSRQYSSSRHERRREEEESRHRLNRRHGKVSPLRDGRRPSSPPRRDSRESSNHRESSSRRRQEHDQGTRDKSPKRRTRDDRSDRDAASPKKEHRGRTHYNAVDEWEGHSPVKDTPLDEIKFQKMTLVPQPAGAAGVPNPPPPTTRAERQRAMTAAMVEAAFNHFDLDGSGFIERKELVGLAKQLGQALSKEEINALMVQIDKSGDGKISLQEFSSWWMEEFAYHGLIDRFTKNLRRFWLKVRSAAAEPAPVGRAGVGWGGHFGWKALTSAKSSVSAGEVKVSMGWNDGIGVSASAQVVGHKLPKEEYQGAMEQIKAPGSTVMVFHVTLKLRETTTPEDVHTMRKAIASVMERRCTAASAALVNAAQKLGMDVQGSMDGSPSRGSGASVVTIKPRVQLTGENTDEGPEEHSLDVDIFMGGVLLESMVATLAKAGLSFTDFPTCSLQCESSVSLRQLLATGPQRLLGLLALRLDISWSLRKRLIRKLLGLMEVDEAFTVALATLLVSVKGEIDMHSPGEMLADLETADDDDGPQRSPEGDTAAGGPSPVTGSGPEDEKDWKYVLQNLTGRQLKAWLQRLSASLEDSMQGQGMEPDRKAMTAMKRFGLYVPQITVYAAGAKVEMTQPGEAPLWPLDTFFNPDLADIPGDSDT